MVDLWCTIVTNTHLYCVHSLYFDIYVEMFQKQLLKWFVYTQNLSIILKYDVMFAVFNHVCYISLGTRADIGSTHNCKWIKLLLKFIFIVGFTDCLHNQVVNSSIIYYIKHEGHNSYVCRIFYILSLLIYSTLRQLSFHCLSTRVRHHIMFLSSVLSSPDVLQSLSCKQQSPLSSQALQLLQTQLYQDEKYLLCFHSFFGAINACSPSCAVRGGEEREKEAVSGEWEKSLFVFVKEEEKSCNYNIGGFGLQPLSSVC